MARKKKADPLAEEDLLEAWSQWLEIVPEEDRLAVGAIIRQVDVSTKAGLNVFLQLLLAALFEGRVHPAVLASARPFVEMLMANVYMMNAANGTPALAGPQGSAALLEMRNLVRERVKSVEPVYTFAEQEEDDIIDSKLTG